ncbi:MAG: hypothetical protein LKJ17_03490 [Oscillospiraceae bacterium]|nr:hypothetical protein [Oscillospiraceae bacterium]
MQNDQEEKSAQSGLGQFFLGLILLGVGLFLFSRRVIVRTDYFFGGGPLRYAASPGLMVLPFLVGVFWMFFNKKSFLAKVVTVLGIALVVFSLIMSIRMTFVSTPLYEYIVIIGMIAAGSGLLFKVLFKSDK